MFTIVVLHVVDMLRLCFFFFKQKTEYEIRPRDWSSDVCSSDLIEYNGGNRSPVVATAVDRPKGALPLRVALSSAGTLDYDEDSLSYAWTIARKDGSVVRTLTDPNPSFTFTRPGTYTATLTVTDAHGAATSATPLEIVAGNQPPTVDVNVVAGNKTFFFPGVPVRYAVRVSDREDGTLASGKIPARRVNVRAQYLKDGPAAGAAAAANRSEEPTSQLQSRGLSRMPSSA